MGCKSDSEVKPEKCRFSKRFFGVKRSQHVFAKNVSRRVEKVKNGKYDPNNFFEVKFISEAGLLTCTLSGILKQSRTESGNIFFARAFGARYNGFCIV